MARHHRPEHRRAGGALRAGIRSSALALPRRHWGRGRAQCRPAHSLRHDRPAGAAPSRVAAGVRYRAIDRTLVPDRRTAEPVRLHAGGTGPAIGDRAAATPDLDVGDARGTLCDGAGLRALPPALEPGGPARTAADLHDRGMALDSARNRIY